MTTVSELIDECSGMLHSYTGLTEASTFLTETITATAETIPVAHPHRLNHGIVEVGDELMLVSDQGDSSITLFPNGRGAMATGAVPHFVNTRVINDPLVPRARIFGELKATIRQLQRDLWIVDTTEILSNPVVNTYEVPANVRRVLRVQVETIGPSKEWYTITNYTLDQHADTDSGKAITLPGNQCFSPSRRIQITYAADLPVPANATDDLESLGIPPEMHDVLKYGACHRAVQTMAPGRLAARSIESQTLLPENPVDSVNKVAQQLFGLFQLRREEERKRLLDMYPPRKHRVR